MNDTQPVLPRIRRRGAWCTLLLMMNLAACAGNPEPIGPEGIVGERARVRFDVGRSDVGTLRGLSGDTVSLETEPHVLRRIQLSPTARLEISRGMESNAGRGAGLGALVGGVGLAIVAAAGSCSDDGDIIEFSPGECALMGGLAGAGAGALVGLIVGSMSESERWVEVERTRGSTDP